MKAKSTPITTHHVTSSTGEDRKKWVESINKELESFYSNHAVEEHRCSLVAMDAFSILWKGHHMTADIPPEHLILLKPPKSLIDLKVIKESKIWLAVRAVYGLRAAPRLGAESRCEIRNV
eukprot:3645019-Amphidinium_carterae.1